jgi:hypothetical protein
VEEFREFLHPEERPLLPEVVSQPISEPASREEREPLVPISRAPSNAFRLPLKSSNEVVPDGRRCPRALREEDVVVVRCQSDDVGLILSVPPAADLGVRVGSAPANGLPGGFETRVL